jgi:hypothetical protein
VRKAVDRTQRGPEIVRHRVCERLKFFVGGRKTLVAVVESRKQMPVLIIVVAQRISSQDHLVGDRLCLTQPENAPRQALPAAERLRRRGKGRKQRGEPAPKTGRQEECHDGQQPTADAENPQRPPQLRIERGLLNCQLSGPAGQSGFGEDAADQQTLEISNLEAALVGVPHGFPELWHRRMSVIFLLVPAPRHNHPIAVEYCCDPAAGLNLAL